MAKDNLMRVAKKMYKGSGAKKKDGMHRPEGAGNFDNADDFNIVDSVDTNTGTIQHTPSTDIDIANKKYVDDTASSPIVTHVSTTGQTTDDHHNESHNINSHVMGDNKIIHTKAAGAITEISLGAAGTVLTSGGEGNDMTFSGDMATNTTHSSGDGSDHADVATNTAASHAESHTIVSHDTTATGAELTTVADGATAKNSHTHTHLSTTGRTANDHHAQSHNAASHSDISATGTEINTACDGATAKNSHTHVSSYDTGWINRSDWTNVHMGTDDTKNADSNVTHNLGAPLSDILVKVLISTDGTDANSFEIFSYYKETTAAEYATQIEYVDNNNILVQTGTSGAGIILSATGEASYLTTQDYHYKIKVYKLT